MMASSFCDSRYRYDCGWDCLPLKNYTEGFTWVYIMRLLADFYNFFDYDTELVNSFEVGYVEKFRFEVEENDGNKGEIYYFWPILFYLSGPYLVYLFIDVFKLKSDPLIWVSFWKAEKLDPFPNVGDYFDEFNN